MVLAESEAVSQDCASSMGSIGFLRANYSLPPLTLHGCLARVTPGTASHGIRFLSNDASAPDLNGVTA